MFTRQFLTHIYEAFLANVFIGIGLVYLILLVLGVFSNFAQSDGFHFTSMISDYLVYLVYIYDYLVYLVLVLDVLCIFN